MWKPLRPMRKVPAIRFIARRRIFFAASIAGALLSLVVLVVEGLNFGVDFAGGILIEARAKQAVDLAKVRASIGELGLGEVSLQGFGAPTDVLIRLRHQPGDEKAQQEAVNRVEAQLAKDAGAGVEIRRVEFVGPQVSRELIEAGALALVVSIVAMMVYIWIRFEWQFGIGSVVALAHDVFLTVGLFAITGIQFDLTSVAAILTIIGYSMNDTVVIYDRVRENLRKYKVMALPELVDLSINETLSRTIMTGGTTLLALLTLNLFGGEVIAGFTLAMLWGVVVGTYSSVYIAAPVLLYTGVRRAERDAAATGPGQAIEGGAPGGR